MGLLSSARRSPWISGAAIMTTAAVIGTALGVSLRARAWWLYLGLILGSLLGLGGLERLWVRRRAPVPPRARGKLKVIRGGKAGYDLEKDDSTNKQRWLM